MSAWLAIFFAGRYLELSQLPKTSEFEQFLPGATAAGGGQAGELVRRFGKPGGKLEGQKVDTEVWVYGSVAAWTDYVFYPSNVKIVIDKRDNSIVAYQLRSY